MTKQKKADKDPRNVMVKALRPHQNSYGAKFKKAKDDTYLHPRPAGDIAAGVVELADEKAKAAKTEGDAKAGKAGTQAPNPPKD